MTQVIYKNGCWGCLKSRQVPSEKYICPQYRQHLKDYKKYDEKFN